MPQETQFGKSIVNHVNANELTCDFLTSKEVFSNDLVSYNSQTDSVNVYSLFDIRGNLTSNDVTIGGTFSIGDTANYNLLTIHSEVSNISRKRVEKDTFTTSNVSFVDGRYSFIECDTSSSDVTLYLPDTSQNKTQNEYFVCNVVKLTPNNTLKIANASTTNQNITIQTPIGESSTYLDIIQDGQTGSFNIYYLSASSGKYIIDQLQIHDANGKVFNASVKIQDNVNMNNTYVNSILHVSDRYLENISTKDSLSTNLSDFQTASILFECNGNTHTINIDGNSFPIGTIHKITKSNHSFDLVIQTNNFQCVSPITGVTTNTTINVIPKDFYGSFILTKTGTILSPVYVVSDYYTSTKSNIAYNHLNYTNLIDVFYKHTNSDGNTIYMKDLTNNTIVIEKESDTCLLISHDTNTIVGSEFTIHKVNDSGKLNVQVDASNSSISSSNVWLVYPNGNIITISSPSTQVEIIPDGFHGSFTISRLSDTTGSGTQLDPSLNNTIKPSVFFIRNLDVFNPSGVKYIEKQVINDSVTVNGSMNFGTVSINASANVANKFSSYPEENTILNGNIKFQNLMYRNIPQEFSGNTLNISGVTSGIINVDTSSNNKHIDNVLNMAKTTNNLTYQVVKMKSSNNLLSTNGGHLTRRMGDINIYPSEYGYFEFYRRNGVNSNPNIILFRNISKWNESGDFIGDTFLAPNLVSSGMSFKNTSANVSYTNSNFVISSDMYIGNIGVTTGLTTNASRFLSKLDYTSDSFNGGITFDSNMVVILGSESVVEFGQNDTSFKKNITVLSNGSTLVPAIRFGESDTIHTDSSNQIIVSTSGTTNTSIHSQGVSLTNDVYANRFFTQNNFNAYLFSSDTNADTGMIYNKDSTNEQLMFVVGGQTALCINGGTASHTNPSVSIGSTNCGFYGSGQNEISVACGGETIQTYTSNSVFFHKPITFGIKNRLTNTNISNLDGDSILQIGSTQSNVNVSVNGLYNYNGNYIRPIAKTISSNNVTFDTGTNTVLDNYVSFSPGVTFSHMNNQYGVIELYAYGTNNSIYTVKNKPRNVSNQNMDVSGRVMIEHTGTTNNISLLFGDTNGVIYDSNGMRFHVGGTANVIKINNNSVIFEDETYAPRFVTTSNSSSSYLFSSDNNINTGIYYENNNIYLSVGGETAIKINKENVTMSKNLRTNTVLFGNSVGLSNPSSGVLNFTSDNSDVTSFSNEGITIYRNTDVTRVNATQFLSSDYLFANDSNKNTGLSYRPTDDIIFRVGGSEYITSKIKINKPLLIDNSSNKYTKNTPAVIFRTDDTNTGIYGDSSKVSFSVSGNDIASVSSDKLTLNNNSLVCSGNYTSGRFISSVSFNNTQIANTNTIGYGFVSSIDPNADSGFYLRNSLLLSMYVDVLSGAENFWRLSIADTFIQHMLNSLSMSGSSQIPAISFGTSLSDSGIFSDESGTVKFSSIGNTALSIHQSGASVTNLYGDNLYSSKYIASGGSNSEPAYCFSNDQNAGVINTGIFYGSHDILRFTSGGVTFIESSTTLTEMRTQSLLIGTQSVNAPALIFSSGDVNSGLYYGSNSINICKNGSDIMNISNSGASMTYLFGTTGTIYDFASTKKIYMTDPREPFSTSPISIEVLFGSNGSGFNRITNFAGGDGIEVIVGNKRQVSTIQAYTIYSHYQFLVNEQGSTSNISYTFNGNTGHGLYNKSDELIIASNRTDVFKMGTTQTMSLVNTFSSNNVSANMFFAPDTSGIEKYAFQTDTNTNTGLHYDKSTNKLLFVCGDTETLSLSDDVIKTNLQIHANRDAQSSSSPSIVFGTSIGSTTGIWGTTSSVSFSLNGNNRLVVGDLGATMSGVTMVGDVYANRVISDSVNFSDIVKIEYDSGVKFKCDANQIEFKHNTVKFGEIVSSNSGILNENSVDYYSYQIGSGGIYSSANESVIGFGLGSNKAIEVNSNANNVTFFNDITFETINNMDIRRVVGKLRNSTYPNPESGDPEYNVSLIGFGNNIYMRTLTSQNSDMQFSIENKLSFQTTYDLTQYNAIWCQLIHSNASITGNTHSVRIPITVIPTGDDTYLISFEFTFTDIQQSNFSLVVWLFEHVDANRDTTYANNFWVSQTNDNNIINYQELSSYYAYQTTLIYTYNSNTDTYSGTYEFKDLGWPTGKNMYGTFEEISYDNSHEQVRVSISYFSGENVVSEENALDTDKWTDLIYMHDSFVEADFPSIARSDIIFN